MKKGMKISTVLTTIILLCSTLSLSSCCEEEELTTQDIALKRNIVGKWKTYSIDGNLALPTKRGSSPIITMVPLLPLHLETTNQKVQVNISTILTGTHI